MVEVENNSLNHVRKYSTVELYKAYKEGLLQQMFVKWETIGDVEKESLELFYAFLSRLDKQSKKKT